MPLTTALSATSVLFLNTSGVVTPPPPWAAFANASLPSERKFSLMLESFDVLFVF